MKLHANVRVSPIAPCSAGRDGSNGGSNGCELTRINPDAVQAMVSRQELVRPGPGGDLCQRQGLQLSDLDTRRRSLNDLDVVAIWGRPGGM